MRLALLLALALPLLGQIVGPRYVSPIWDRVDNRYVYAFLPDGTTVEKSTIPGAPEWAYQIVMPPGTANPSQVLRLNPMDFDTTHTPDGESVSIRWPLPIPGPKGDLGDPGPRGTQGIPGVCSTCPGGTTGGAAYVFDPVDFDVTRSGGQDIVVVRWPLRISGALLAGTTDFILRGFITEPIDCAVYRDGLHQTWVWNDYQYLAPAEPGGEWSLRFTRSTDKQSVIEAFCLKAP